MAADYRRLARESKRRFAGTVHVLKRHLPLIVATLRALADPDLVEPLEATLAERERHGWTDLVAAIRRILAGERDADALCDPLDLEDSMIVETILQTIEEPSTSDSLLADQGEAP